MLGLCVAVVLAGCTAAEGDPMPLGERDRTAVLAALRALDTCALLDAATADAVPSGGEREIIFPARCAVVDHSDPTYYVGIDVLDRWPEPIEYGDFERREVEGVTAYLDDTQNCYVYLPISPTTAVEIQAAYADAPCDLAEPVAAAAVRILDDPDQVPAEPRWDPCDAFRTAHGGPAADYRGTPFPDAGCHHPDAVFSFVPGRPQGAIRDVDDAEWRTGTVAGAQVWFGEDPATGDCYARWTAATEHDSPYRQRGVVAQVKAAGCDDARTVASPLVEVLKGPPPDVAPQRPLLYPA